MKKVYYRNKLFKVIPENNSVECKASFKDFPGDLKGIKEIYDHIIKSAMVSLYPERYSYIVDGNDNEIVGIAAIADFVKATSHCDIKDTFDEHTGINVCSAKIEKKNHLKLAKMYDRLQCVLFETAFIAAKLCIKHAKKAEAIEEDLCKHYGRMPL